MDFFAWSTDTEPARPHDVTQDGVWSWLLDYYTDGRGNPVLERVIGVAQELGVASVLVETRYLDADWRSEHAQFYSTTFTRYPSVAHRMHFFTAPLPADLGDLSAMAATYVGYSVLRPVPFQPVGRTMLKPPPELNDATRCEAVESVDVLGWQMRVCGMPFISQDAQYLRCAHADIWMALRHAYLLGQVSRKTCAQVHDATMGGVVVGRQVPSDGLSIQQMLAGMTSLGLSPGLLRLPGAKDESEKSKFLSLFAIVCRYVNSNIAPIIASDDHVWMIIAYQRKPSGAHTGLTLYRHDDAKGPYLRVDDPWNESDDSYVPWSHTLLPLPPKIYMSAERAEVIGAWWFGLRADASELGNDDPLVDARSAGELAFTTYGVDASRFKFDLAGRLGVDPKVAREYRLSQWSRNLWVIEAVDRRLRASGAHAVLGEVIIDPTANQYPNATEPGIIAAHAPGLLWLVSPDTKADHVSPVSTSTYATGRPIHAI